MHCPICNQQGAVCGGPSRARPIDDPITLETTMADNDMEMVKVHVDDGTKRGYDLKYTRKDAAKFLAYTPNAQIVEDAAPAEEEAPAEEPEPEAKAVEKAPANKSQAKAESK